MRLEFDTAGPAERMMLLDDAGLEGWELVQLFDAPTPHAWAIFKRPYVADE